MIEPPKRGRGRPRLDSDRKRGYVLGVRLQPSERAAIERAAHLAGVTPAEYARGTLLRAASRANRKNRAGD